MKKNDDNIVEIFTDGACRGNPGPGGWGAILRFKGKEKTLHGGERETTNNRMEMMAAISALESLTRPPRHRKGCGNARRPPFEYRSGQGSRPS